MHVTKALVGFTQKAERTKTFVQTTTEGRPPISLLTYPRGVVVKSIRWKSIRVFGASRVIKQ